MSLVVESESSVPLVQSFPLEEILSLFQQVPILRSYINERQVPNFGFYDAAFSSRLDLR
jgi:hypothetical protein